MKVKMALLLKDKEEPQSDSEELEVLSVNMPLSSRLIKQEKLNELNENVPERDDVQQQQEEKLEVLFHKSPLSSRPIKHEILNEDKQQSEVQQGNASTCSLSTDVLLPTAFVSIDQVADQVKQEPANADFLTDPLAPNQPDLGSFALKKEITEPTPNNQVTNCSGNNVAIGVVKKELDQIPRSDGQLPVSVKMNKSAIIQKWKEIFKGKIPKVDGTTSKTPKNNKTATSRKTKESITEEISRTESTKSNGGEAAEKIYDYFKEKNKSPLFEKRCHDLKRLSDLEENGKAGQEPTIVNQLLNEKLIKKAYVRLVKLDNRWMESSAVDRSVSGNKENKVVTCEKEKDSGMNFACDAENRQDGEKSTKSEHRKNLKELIGIDAIPNETLLSKAYVPLVKVDEILKEISPTNLKSKYNIIMPSKNIDTSEHLLRNGKLFNVNVSKNHASHHSCKKDGFKSKSDVRSKNVRKKTVANANIKKCRDCGKSFESKLEYKKHSQTHLRSWFYKCNYCKAVFVYPAVFKKHLLNHVVAEHLIGLDDKLIHNKYKHFIREHTLKIKKELYHKNMKKCKECSKTFATFSSYLYHSKTHESNYEFKCEECPAAFKRRSHLKIHYQLHIKPFKCNKCDMSFQAKSALKSHLAGHSRKRMLKCDKCDSRFKYLKVFRNHVLREHAIPFSCNVCSLYFATSHEMLEHKRIHT